MQNQIQRGEVITIVAAAAIASGEVVKIGDLVGVAGISAAIGEECEIALKGVYEVPKAAGAISQGAKVYFSDANNNVSTTNTDTFAGYAFKAALSGDATAMVLLSKIFTESIIAGSTFEAVGPWDGGSQMAMLYAPAGASPDTPLPCIMYLNGGGENGTDLDLLKSAVLPLLLDQGQEQQSYVFCPQTATGWTSAQVKAAYDWIVANRNIDTTRIYGTGASSGAGAVAQFQIDFPGLMAAGFVAGLPANSISANVSAFANFPLYVTQGMQDVITNVTIAATAVDAINATNPAIPAKLRTVWDGVHNSSTWNPKAFDTSLAGYNFETDFLLLHTTDSEQTAGNYVSRAENVPGLSVDKVVAYLEAKSVVDALPSGAAKTALLSRLAAVLSLLNTGQKVCIVDLGQGAFPAAPNQNKISAQVDGAESGFLVAMNGDTTAIKFRQVMNQWEGELDSCPVGKHFGLANYRDGFRIESAANRWAFDGLTGNVDLGFFYSTKNTVNTVEPKMQFIVSGDAANSIDDSYNTTNYAVLLDEAPSSGTITIDLHALTGLYSIVNTLILIQK